MCIYIKGEGIGKAAVNLEKHGVNFEVVFDPDWPTAPILDDHRFEYGEARYIMYGRSPAGDRYVVAFTLRSGTYRIISVRPFGRREWKLYGDDNADQDQAYLRGTGRGYS